MTREELREAVARAIREAPMRATQKGGAIDTTIPLTESELLRADAALSTVREALREPTPEMLKAAHHEEDQCAIHNYGGSPRVEDIWAIMFGKSALGGPGHE